MNKEKWSSIKQDDLDETFKQVKLRSLHTQADFHFDGNDILS